MGSRLDERLAVFQGAFYVASGLWPIMHLRSFEAVTGPKPEGWLVKTVGALLAVGGASMLAAGSARSVGTPTAVLAAGSAAALAAVDVWYAGVRRRIAPIYLADAVVQATLVGLWALARAPRRAHVPSNPALTRAVAAETSSMVE